MQHLLREKEQSEDGKECQNTEDDEEDAHGLHGICLCIGVNPGGLGGIDPHDFGAADGHPFFGENRDAHIAGSPVGFPIQLVLIDGEGGGCGGGGAVVVEVGGCFCGMAHDGGFQSLLFRLFTSVQDHKNAGADQAKANQ